MCNRYVFLSFTNVEIPDMAQNRRSILSKILITVVSDLETDEYLIFVLKVVPVCMELIFIVFELHGL